MICDSVAILDQGELVRQGTIKELTEKSRRYEIRVGGSISGGLRDQFCKNGAELNGDTLRVYHASPEPMQPIIDALRAEGLTIMEMREVRQSLEELFMEVVQSNGAGAMRPPALPPTSAPTLPPTSPRKEMVK